jgi:hypothetical protein
MDISVVEEAHDLKALCLKDFQWVYGAGRTTNMQQDFHQMGKDLLMGLLGSMTFLF